jgi:hypothetical protein
MTDKARWMVEKLESIARQERDADVLVLVKLRDGGIRDVQTFRGSDDKLTRV